MGIEQSEGGAEAQAELENMGMEELNAKKQELQKEFDKLLYEDRAEVVKAMEEKYPEMMAGEEFPEGMKEGQKEQLEAVEGGTPLADVKDVVSNIDTSRMPFVDAPMKKIQKIMDSSEVAQLIQIDSQIDGIKAQQGKIEEQIKIQETRAGIQAA